MSRFDYRDPGTDPAYCDGLQADEPETDAPMNPALGQPLSHLVTPVQRQEPVEDIDSDRPVWCIWCKVERVDPDHYPYCSTTCAVQAEVEG